MVDRHAPDMSDLEALIERFQRGTVSRRDFMKKLILAGFSLSAVGAIVAACGSSSPTAPAGSRGGSSPVSAGSGGGSFPATAGATPTATVDATRSRGPVVNVRDYGALGNDSHDETAAFAAASAFVAAAGGGTIYVPDGAYRASQIAPGAGVTIQGQSRAGTILKMFGTSATKLDLSDCLVWIGAANVCITNLTLRGRGAARAAYDEVLLGLEGYSGTPTGFIAQNITIDHASGRGLFTLGTGCASGTYNDILVSNTFEGNGSLAYGIAVFFFDGFRNNTVSHLSTDTSGSGGLVVDSGSSTGNYDYCQYNDFNHISITKADQQTHPYPAALVKGIRYNSFDTVTISDCQVNESNALTLERQQQGLYCTDNTFTNWTVRDIGGQLINLQSVSSNTFRHWTASNIAKIWWGSLARIGWTDMNGGASGGGSNDNVFDDIHLDKQADKKWYANGVLFDTQHEPMYRNTFSNMNYSAPTGTIVGYLGNPALAPLSGANANTGLPIPAVPSDVVLAEPSLISTWLFKETSGTSAADGKGSNTGTFVNAPTLNVAGPSALDSAKAITLASASNQYVTVPHSNSLDQGDGPLSWEIWFKRASDSDLGLMEKGTHAPYVFHNQGGKVGWLAKSWDSAVDNTGHLIADTGWHHFVGTKLDHTHWLIYLDGVDVTHVVTADTTTISTTAVLTIGTAGGYPWNGSIFLPAIYSAVLTPTQVAAHYHAGVGG